MAHQLHRGQQVPPCHGGLVGIAVSALAGVVLGSTWNAVLISAHVGSEVAGRHGNRRGDGVLQCRPAGVPAWCTGASGNANLKSSCRDRRGRVGIIDNPTMSDDVTCPSHDHRIK